VLLFHPDASPHTYVHILTPANAQVPIEPGNDYVPVLSNVRFTNVSGHGGCSIACSLFNGSACHNLSFAGTVPDHCHPPALQPPLPPSRFTCKATAAWPVCLPLDAPVNNDPAYPNWGPTVGDYASLEACRAACS